MLLYDEIKLSHKKRQIIYIQRLFYALFIEIIKLIVTKIILFIN